jgi:phenylalanyl-tRNA synthetase beta chain
VEIAENLNADFLAQFPKIDPNKICLQLSEMLAASGFREIITNSLTKPAYNDALRSNQASVIILNKLSEDLGVLRQSLLFSGLEVIAHNINRKQKNLKIFEFGTTYAAAESKYLETKELSVFITGNYSTESWMLPAQPASFHYLSSTITKIFNRFGIDKFESAATQHSIFSYGLNCSIRQKQIATLGKVKEEITALAGVKQEVFYAVLNWNALLHALKVYHQEEQHIFQEISKFPEVYRDLSLILDKTISFNQIEKIAREQGGQLLKDINVFDVYEGENIGAGKKAYALTFVLQDQNKTLDDKTIDNIMDRLMQAYEKHLGAIIRK